MSKEALTMRGPVHGTKDARRVAIGSGVGAVIETYDFIGFGTAAALYFGTAFFPTGDPVTGTLAAFATLGVGFAARPIGGIIGGHLGDKLGRKPVLVASLILMGVATFLIGLLPPTPKWACWLQHCWCSSASSKAWPSEPNGAEPF
ncbi:shikimate transporter [Arthrobacter sp. Hiyo8]|nr:shikimate transporter [Arthrobacter sp. Hiyo8]